MCIIYIYIFIIHSSVDGQLGRIPFFALVNKAAINKGMQISVGYRALWVICHWPLVLFSWLLQLYRAILLLCSVYYFFFSSLVALPRRFSERMQDAGGTEIACQVKDSPQEVCQLEPWFCLDLKVHPSLLLFMASQMMPSWGCAICDLSVSRPPPSMYYKHLLPSCLHPIRDGCVPAQIIFRLVISERKLRRIHLWFSCSAHVQLRTAFSLSLS